MEIKTKYGAVKIFTDNIEQESMDQVIKMGNSRLGEGAHIRIMPDCHAGKGCTVGTTMVVTDKICPNLIGVDIGCGVNLIMVKENLSGKGKELDNAIRKYIPYGYDIHDSLKEYSFDKMKCWEYLDIQAKQRSQYSLGSLGGGNHFIEAYKNGISVHSGSRNIGQAVAVYYQKLAQETIKDIKQAAANAIPVAEREDWLKKNKFFVEPELSYLMGNNMLDYIHDMNIIQQFAVENRNAILEVLVKKLKLTVTDKISSIHNYIDTNTLILRKGAISANKDELMVIPLNMRDGMLICKGKGNEEWNNSAPHGAGRLYSRSKAKAKIDLAVYQKSMQGIYSTCVNKNTLDESPFAYKKYKEIMCNIEPTVDIVERLIPVFNFKAN